MNQREKDDARIELAAFAAGVEGGRRDLAKLERLAVLHNVQIDSSEHGIPERRVRLYVGAQVYWGATLEEALAQVPE